MSCASGSASRHRVTLIGILAELRVHAFQSLGCGRLAHARADAGGAAPAARIEGYPVAGRRGRDHRCAAQRARRCAAARSSPYDHLVIATGPKLAFDEVPGLGPNGFTQSICTQAHAVAGLGAIPAVPAEPRSDRGRGGGRRKLLWSGVRVRDDPRCRPAQAQDSRPGTDDVRDQRAVHRTHGIGRCRRQQGAHGDRAAAAPHQVDHQCQDHGGHGRLDVRDRARRGGQGEERGPGAVQVRDDSAGLQRRGRGRGVYRICAIRADSC